MSPTLQLKKILNVKEDLSNPLMMWKVITRAELTKDTAFKVAGLLNLTTKEFCGLLPTSERTMQRKKDSDRLSIAVIEHIMELAEIAAIAGEVFEDSGEVKDWLHESNDVLKGAKPIEIMNTVIGCNLVRKILGRIQYGVYS